MFRVSSYFFAPVLETAVELKIKEKLLHSSNEEFCEEIYRQLEIIRFKKLQKLEGLKPKDESCYQAELQKLRLGKLSTSQLRRIYQKIEHCIEKETGIP